MIEFRVGRRDYLTRSERFALRKLSSRVPLIRHILRQLERVIVSRTFERAQNTTKDFLAFVVSKALIGGADEIKEMTVAVRVFCESTSFDPLENSKVRVSGLALRRRLACYSAHEGARDPIEITLPVGSYVPRIRLRSSKVYAATLNANKCCCCSWRRDCEGRAHRRVQLTASRKHRRRNSTNPRLISPSPSFG